MFEVIGFVLSICWCIETIDAFLGAFFSLIAPLIQFLHMAIQRFGEDEVGVQVGLCLLVSPGVLVYRPWGIIWGLYTRR